MTDTEKLERAPTQHVFEVSNGSIAFGGNQALSSISFGMEKGQLLGLIGPNGSGKTTLVDILLGLLTPNNGSILVDQTVINQENLAAWQKNIGYVPQNIYLTDDTIERNIAFSEFENIDTEQVKKAAILANLDVFY